MIDAVNFASKFVIWNDLLTQMASMIWSCDQSSPFLRKHKEETLRPKAEHDS